MSREFNVTMVGLRIASPEQSIVVAVGQWDPNLQLFTQVGSVFPAFSGATGRCLAAFGDWTDAELREQFKSLTWDNPPTFDEWMSDVSRTRERGFALDMGVYISGVTVVLAPVWDAPGELGHALIAFGISDALKPPKLKQLQASLVAEGKALTRQLCGFDPQT
jgi:DNA-binding IclR family transcriptional regulator